MRKIKRNTENRKKEKGKIRRGKVGKGRGRIRRKENMITVSLYPSHHSFSLPSLPSLIMLVSRDLMLSGCTSS